MKLHKLVIACGGLFAAGAGAQAFAVDLYVSGSSSLQISFQKVVGEMCNPLPTPAFFTNATGESYQCMSKTTGPGAPFPGVSKILNIWKRNAGGSYFGILPVANSNMVAFTSQTGCSPGTPSTVTIGDVPGWVNNTNCPNTPLIVPHAGLSDVEPELFRNQGYTGGLAASTSIVAQVFGIPVNDKLYRKLQVIQQVNNWTTLPQVLAGDPLFLPIHAPSLTYAQVRSLFTSNYNDWAQVHSGITDAGNGTTAAKVCRRVVTSGAQAVINALLLDNPCHAGPFGGVLIPSNNLTDSNIANNTLATAGAFSPTFGGNDTVVMNSTAAQVDACLTDADKQGELAIGLLGTERRSSQVGSPPNAPNDDPDGRADQWHYVKLSGGVQTQQATPSDATYQHGAYPSVDNTIASTYDLYAEAIFHRRTSGYNPDQITLMNKLQVMMGNPAIIGSEGLYGLVALHPNGYTPADYPTLRGSRFGNTCRSTTLQYGNP